MRKPIDNQEVRFFAALTYYAVVGSVCTAVFIWQELSPWAVSITIEERRGGAAESKEGGA